MTNPRGYGPIFGLGLLSGAIIVVVTILPFRLTRRDTMGVEMSYADLAAIMLSAVSVIVTVLGVIIAILALWGFRHFKDTAASVATSHVDGKIEQITTKVEDAVVAHVIKELESGKIKSLLDARADYYIKYGPQIRSDREEWDGDEEKEYGA